MNSEKIYTKTIPNGRKATQHDDDTKRNHLRDKQSP